MTRGDAQTAVNSAALVSGGGFLYLHLIKKSEGKMEPVGAFVVGWGFSMIVLSMLADAEPNFGGALAILVAVAALLYSGTQVLAEISSQTKERKQAPQARPGARTVPPTIPAPVVPTQRI